MILMKLMPLKAEIIIKILHKIGFEMIRHKGSHAFLRHPDGRTTVIPIHPREKIDRRLIRKIMNDANLSREEFLKILDSL